LNLKVIALSGCFALGGCIVSATQEGNAIRIIDKQSDYKCKFIKSVTGSGSLGWTTAHDAEGAMNQVSNRAAEAGANAIRIINVNSDLATSVVVAEALSCVFDY
jgi:uncharacterized protein YbjQ (UPF0145 family)